MERPVSPAAAQLPGDPRPPQPLAYPTALFVFEERGSAARDLGQKVIDLLFAKLVVKDGLAHERLVATGQVEGDLIEVKGNVAADELVAISNVEQLADGMPVRQ